MYTCLSLCTLVVSWQAVPCAVLVCGREDDSLFVGFLLSVTCLEVNVKVSVPRRFSALPMPLAYYVWPRCPSQHTSKVTNTVHSSVSNWWTRVIFGQQLNSQVCPLSKELCELNHSRHMFPVSSAKTLYRLTCHSSQMTVLLTYNSAGTCISFSQFPDLYVTINIVTIRPAVISCMVHEWYYCNI